jgi:Domain of unknown function (DUF5615)
MAKVSFYFDEHVQAALAEALKTRGVSILTTQEAGNVGVEDIHQLAYATKNGRAMLSYNKRDFALIHYQWMRIGRSHSGIILSDQLPIGVILRRIMKLYYSVDQDGMKNRLEYLGAWK